jgi:hypothetical protein
MSNVSHWDGTDWQPVGSGFSSGIGFSGSVGITMTQLGDNYYVGGLFSMAGGKRSFNIARYNEDPSDVHDEALPTEFALKQNYPNPFNPSTNICFTLPVSSFVSVKVYNTLGAEVAELTSQYYDAGKHTVQFDAAGFPSGVYYYRLKTEQFIETKKMVLLR